MALKVPLVPGQTASNRMNQVRQQQRLAKGGAVKTAKKVKAKKHERRR
jgi:hypothetical protein